MTKKQLAVLAVEGLKTEYPDAICSLNYSDPFQLLIATRLSAQCTDARVNMVTPDLFDRFPTAEDFSAAELSEVEELIKIYSSDKVLFGTDFPMWSHEKELREFMKLNISDADKKKILYDNAVKVFSLENL